MGLFIFPFLIQAKTINVASCNQADVQTAIDFAVDGDTVEIPAGECSWANQLIIKKSLVLRGAGNDLTKINHNFNGSLVHIELNADVPLRITNLFINSQTNNTGYSSIYIKGSVNGSYALTRIRIDHNKINKGTRAIFLRGWIEGLIDNNIFINNNIAIGPCGDYHQSWNRPIVAGTINSLFIEDNLFLINNNADREPNHLIYNQEGARSVTRYNVFDGTAYTNGSSIFYDSHGNQKQYNPDNLNACDFRGQPILEVYNNIMKGYKSYSILDFRGGSVLFFNNEMSLISGSKPYIDLREEESWTSGGQYCPACPADTVWPAEDQITNSFFWNNVSNGTLLTEVNLRTDQEIEFIQENRDYFMHEPSAIGGKSIYTGRQGAAGNGSDGTLAFSSLGANAYYPYSPYIYPHPLRTNCTMYPSLCDSGSQPSCTIFGDVVCDQEVNSLDIQAVINIFLGINTDADQRSRADLNGDSMIDILDIQRIIYLFLGL